MLWFNFQFTIFPIRFFKSGLDNQEKGDYQGAIADYTQAIAIDPNKANAYNNRGIAYHNLEEYQRALEDYKKAAQLFRQQGNEADYQNALNQIYKLQQ